MCLLFYSVFSRLFPVDHREKNRTENFEGVGTQKVPDIRSTDLRSHRLQGLNFIGHTGYKYYPLIRSIFFGQNRTFTDCPGETKKQTFLC